MSDQDLLLLSAYLLARTPQLTEDFAEIPSRTGPLEVKGLGLVSEPDLSVFVPVNAEDVAKFGWHKMPSKVLPQSGRPAGVRPVCTQP